MSPIQERPDYRKPRHALHAESDEMPDLMV
jgi:hypothetical protein